MRIDFNISQSERSKFRVACEAAIQTVGVGTKAASEAAAYDIMSESLRQVPVDTGTLINSAYMGISRRTNVKNYRYGAILGYGSPGGLESAIGLGEIEWHIAPNNGVNPKSGYQASTYASKVHEDLDMPHPNGGKAKFLEDPVRNYASGRFYRTAVTYWKEAIEWINLGRLHNSYDLATRSFKLKFSKRPMMVTRHTFKVQSSHTQRKNDYVNRGDHRDEF